jgi:uncharacterized protein (DUF427 family)
VNHPIPDVPGPGQESVWDYPRPPALRPCDAEVHIALGGQTVASTTLTLQVLETSHPPSWYLPPEAWVVGALVRSGQRGTVCEWKGRATYWDVVAGNLLLPCAAWSYEDPTPAFADLKDWIACYPTGLAVHVDGERVRPQEGGFYGGWVTDSVAGPVKGAPGSLGW